MRPQWAAPLPPGSAITVIACRRMYGSMNTNMIGQPRDVKSRDLVQGTLQILDVGWIYHQEKSGQYLDVCSVGRYSLTERCRHWAITAIILSPGVWWNEYWDIHMIYCHVTISMVYMPWCHQIPGYTIQTQGIQTVWRKGIKYLSQLYVKCRKYLITSTFVSSHFTIRWLVIKLQRHTVV